MMPESARILTTACPNQAVPLEGCQRECGKVIRSASPRRSRYTEPSSLPPFCTVRTPGFSTGSRSGYFSGFIKAACAPFLASNGKTTCQTMKSSSQPAQHRVNLASDASTLGWPHHKDGEIYAYPKQSSSANSQKESVIVVLQESVTKTS